MTGKENLATETTTPHLQQHMYRDHKNQGTRKIVQLRQSSTGTLRIHDRTIGTLIREQNNIHAKKTLSHWMRQQEVRKITLNKAAELLNKKKCTLEKYCTIDQVTTRAAHTG
jgi:hypothetical protein